MQDCELFLYVQILDHISSFFPSLINIFFACTAAFVSGNFSTSSVKNEFAPKRLKEDFNSLASDEEADCGSLKPSRLAGFGDSD